MEGAPGKENFGVVALDTGLGRLQIARVSRGTQRPVRSPESRSVSGTVIS